MANLTADIIAKTLVIIPAYNEGGGIAKVVRGIRTDFPGIDVVVVDDGSTDDTVAEASGAGAKVLSLVNNMGYGIALQTGYKYAVSQGVHEYCVQMDGDGQHNWQDIGKLLEPVVQKRADLVIGSRFINGQNGYTIPLARRLGIWFFRTLVQLYTKQNVKDITSGLQAFNSKLLKRYVSDTLPYYYPDADVLILLIKGGFRVVEVSTPMREGNGKSMHTGICSQGYYVATMVLSILVILLKGRGENV